MILLHLPTSALTRALRVSTHCRDVILGNKELRENLFLDPAQATDYLETRDWSPVVELRSSYEVIVQERSQESQDRLDSRVLVNAHPVLEALATFDDQAYRHKRCEFDHRFAEPYWHPDGPYLQTEEVSCSIMRSIPAQTFLFQPPVTDVKMVHHNFEVTLECDEGVTFGMVAKQLELMHVEEKRYFRKQLKRLRKGLITAPFTYESRQAYASAMAVLNGSCSRNWCSLLGLPPCLYFEAQDAISKSSEGVCEAMKRMELLGRQDSGAIHVLPSHTHTCM